MDYATKIVDVVGKYELSGTSIRRAMRNHLAAEDVEKILGQLVNEGTLTRQDRFYKRVVKETDMSTWQQG